MQRQRESLLQQQQPMFGQLQPMFAPPMTYMPVLGLVRPLVCISVMLLIRYCAAYLQIDSATWHMAA